MKGLSKFITYTTTIMLGFAILIFFSTTIYSYYYQTIKANIKASLKQIDIQTANAIIKLYGIGKESDISPINSSSVVIWDEELNYPNDVNGKNFEVELISSPGIWNLVTNLTIEGKNVTIKKETSSGSKIIARTTQRPIESYEYDVANIPVVLQGKFKSGENDTIRLVRYNYNGTIEDRIILGESNIIVGIKSIT